MQVQFSNFACNNKLISMMKDANSFYSLRISVKELLYFPTMQFSSFKFTQLTCYIVLYW